MTRAELEERMSALVRDLDDDLIEAGWYEKGMQVRRDNPFPVWLECAKLAPIRNGGRARFLVRLDVSVEVLQDR